MRDHTLHRLALKLVERELDHRTLADEGLGLLREYLDSRMLMWTTLDPVTLLPTSLHLPGFILKTAGFVTTSFFYKQFARFDLDPDETLSIPWLVEHEDTYASLYRATGGEMTRSKRYVEVLGRLGVKDELRLLLTDAGQIWGLISACKRTAPFTDSECEAMSRIGPLFGAALRRAFLRAALDANKHVETRPGLLLFDDHGEVEHVSEEARALLGDQIEHSKKFWLSLLQLHEEGEGPVSLTVVTDEGPITLHLSKLGGREAIIADRSRPGVLAGLLIKAYGLTTRESEVVAALCRGWATRRIAFEMDISDWTVQDHLKSIFDKVGVRSRKELISHLLHNHYLPQSRNKATPSPSGWFLE